MKSIGLGQGVGGRRRLASSVAGIGHSHGLTTPTQIVGGAMVVSFCTNETN